MPVADFRTKAGAFLETPPPTSDLMQMSDAVQQAAPQKEETVGFLESVFMGREQRKFLSESGDIQDSLPEAILRDFIQPVANLGQDLYRGTHQRSRAANLEKIDQLSTPQMTQTEIDIEKQKVATLLSAGKITTEQAAEFNSTLDASGVAVLSSERADEMRRTIGETPSLKMVLGDLGGTALTAVSFFPALGAVKAAQAAKAARAAVVAGKAVEATAQVSKLGRLSPYVRAALNGGGYVAAFNGTQAASDNESIADIAKSSGLGFLAGAALGAGGTLAVKTFTRVASLGKNVVTGLTTKIGEVEAIRYMGQYVRPVISVIEKDFGEAGRVIAQRLKAADTSVQTSLGRVMRIMDDVGGRFKSNLEGRESSYQLGRLLRGKVESTEVARLAPGRITGRLEAQSGKAALGEQPAIFGTELPKDLAEASPESFYRAFFGDIAAEAETRGLQIRVPAAKGEPARWTKFESLDNYFPQQVPDVKELKPGSRLREWVLRRTVDDGEFKTIDEASAVLDDYIAFVQREGKGVAKQNGWLEYLVKSGQAENMDEAKSLMDEVFKRQSSVKLGGSLENARIVNNPFYNPFPDEVAPLYAADALTRLENIAQLGVKYTKGGAVQAPELSKAFALVRETQGNIQKEHFRNFVDVALNNINNATPGAKIAHFVTALQIPKLAFAQIVNVGQAFLNPLLKTDIRATATGLMKAFTHDGSKRALESGATLQSVFNEMVHSVAGGGNVGDKFLKTVGFVWTEKFNRTVAANVGVEWAGRNFEKLVANPGRQIFRQRLTEMGINVERALARGKLTDNELLKAGQLIAEKTQFRSRPMDLPMFATHPAGKVFWQFKNFAYNQLNFVFKENLINEVKAGNYARAARNVMVLGTVFPMTGEVLQDVRSLITQSRRPTNALDRYISDLAGAGAMGLISDFMDSVRFDRTTDLLVSPTGGTISDIVDNLDDPDKLLDVMLRQTGFGSPIVNVKSKKRKGYESSIESLQRIFGE